MFTFEYPYRSASVPLGKLFIDRQVAEDAFTGYADAEMALEYQRGRTARTDRIKADFDPMLFERIVVNLRPDGTYSVLDGGTRITALHEMGCDPAQKIECDVYSVLPVEEPMLFANVNRLRTTVPRTVEFNARIIAAEPVARKMATILAEAGLEFARNEKATQGRVGCISAVESIFKRAGGEHDLKLVATLIGGIKDRPNATHRVMWDALGAIVSRHDPAFSPERMARALAETAPAYIIEQARTDIRVKPLAGGGSQSGLSMAAARVLLDRYNRLGRKGRLAIAL